MKTKLLLAFLLLIVSSVNVQSETYYVDGSHPAASDSNSGISADEPWKTINHAANMLQAGDTVLINDGRYDVGHPPSGYNAASIRPTNSGTPGNPIVFKAINQGGPVLYKIAPPADTVQSESGRINQRPIIGAINRDYIVFDGLTIEMTGTNVWGAYIHTSVGSQIKRCEFIGNNIYYEPMYPHTGLNHDAIFIQNCDDFIIADCRITTVLSRDSMGTSCNQNSSAIKMYNNRNTLIEHNFIEDCCVGVYDKQQGSTGTIIRRNIIQNNRMNIYTSQRPWRNANIYENILVNGAALEKGSSSWIEGMNFYNNTIYCDDSVDFDIWALVLFYSANPVQQLSVYNNIFLDLYTRRNNYTVQLQHQNHYDITYWDNNIYSPGMRIYVNHPGTENDSLYNDLSLWQRMRGHDQHSFIDDPLFIDASAGNFRLHEDSPARKAGRYGEDIGAYPRDDDTIIGPRLSEHIVVNIDEQPDIPKHYALHQNYPNPYNPTTTISYAIAAGGNVLIIVYDMLGREVAVLVNEIKPPGSYSVRWDGTNRRGMKVGSGVYFYQLKTDDGYMQTKRMLRLK